RRRRQKYFPTDVGARETSGRRLDCGELGGDEESDAIDGRESASHFRRSGSAFGRGCADGKGRKGPDCRDRFRRKHRSRKILRTNRLRKRDKLVTILDLQ